jgi:hypothetical protein
MPVETPGADQLASRSLICHPVRSEAERWDPGELGPGQVLRSFRAEAHTIRSDLRRLDVDTQILPD